MNKLCKVLALATLLIFGGQAMAQVHGAMFFGASVPQKNFATFNDFNDFALTSTDIDADYAGAGIGFNAGLRWYFNVGVKDLDVLFSIDGLYNGPCSNLKNTYRDMESSFDGQIIDRSFRYDATPKYINIPAMLGVNYTYHLNPNFGLFVEAGAGANLRFITGMESVSQTNIAGIDTRTTTIQKYESAFSFAYQLGLGIEVAQNLVIGCSFYDLGGASVAGEQTIKTKTLNDNVSSVTNEYRELGTVHPVMILGRIGFRL